MRPVLSEQNIGYLVVENVGYVVDLSWKNEIGVMSVELFHKYGGRLYLHSMHDVKACATPIMIKISRGISVTCGMYGVTD